MCMPSPGTTSEAKCAESWNWAVSAARTMSHSRGISECRHAGPLIALMIGTSMFRRFIKRWRPSQWMRSMRSIDGRVGKEDVPGVARGPENSGPVPVRMTTRFSRSAPMSWKASGSSPCGRNPQRSDWPSVWSVTCRMPFRRSIRADLYLRAYSSSELISTSQASSVGDASRVDLVDDDPLAVLDHGHVELGGGLLVRIEADGAP